MPINSPPGYSATIFTKLLCAVTFGAIFLALFTLPLNLIPQADGTIAQPRQVTPRSERSADEKQPFQVIL